MLFTYEFIANRNNIFANLLMLIITVALFPIFIKDGFVLQNIGPSIIFICVILTLHVIFYDIFRSEYSSGVMEQILLQPISLPLFIGKKLLWHTVFYQGVILIITPILGIMLSLDYYTIYRTFCALLLTIPVIISLSSAIGVLSSNQNNNIVVSILTLPLLIPVSILAHSIIYSVGNSQEILLLLLLVLFTLPLNLITICYFLQVEIESAR